VTAKARSTFLGSFLDAVDPQRQLPESERLRRAEAAKKAHFARLAYHSAIARAKKKAATSTKVTALEVRHATADTTAS